MRQILFNLLRHCIRVPSLFKMIKRDNIRNELYIFNLKKKVTYLLVGKFSKTELSIIGCEIITVLIYCFTMLRYAVSMQ